MKPSTSVRPRKTLSATGILLIVMGLVQFILAHWIIGVLSVAVGAVLMFMQRGKDREFAEYDREKAEEKALFEERTGRH